MFQILFLEKKRNKIKFMLNNIFFLFLNFFDCMLPNTDFHVCRLYFSVKMIYKEQ